MLTVSTAVLNQPINSQATQLTHCNRRNAPVGLGFLRILSEVSVESAGRVVAPVRQARGQRYIEPLQELLDLLRERLLPRGPACRKGRAVFRGGGPELQQSGSPVETLRERDRPGERPLFRRPRGTELVPGGLVVPLGARPTILVHKPTRELANQITSSVRGLRSRLNRVGATSCERPVLGYSSSERIWWPSPPGPRAWIPFPRGPSGAPARPAPAGRPGRTGRGPD